MKNLRSMEKGYVYIGRLIDHNGKFLNNAYKIGKTIDLKTRETSLNSTNMPLDVFFIRIFETDNMSSLENTLHILFEENRIIKKYDWRKDIKTEWFEIIDEDSFNNKLSRFVKYFPNVNEISEDIIEKSIMSDTGQTMTQKVEIINNIKEGRKTLRIFNDTEEFFGNSIIERMIQFGEYLSNTYDREILVKTFPNYFKIEENQLPPSMERNNRNKYVKLDNGLYFITWGSINQKKGMIENITKKLDIKTVKCVVE